MSRQATGVHSGNAESFAVAQQTIDNSIWSTCCGLGRHLLRMEKCRPIAVKRPPERPPREERGKKEPEGQSPFRSFPWSSPPVPPDLRESEFSPLLAPPLPPDDSSAGVSNTTSPRHDDPLNPATVSLVPFAVSCRTRPFEPLKSAEGYRDMSQPGESGVKSEGSGSSTVSDPGGSGAGSSTTNESVKSRRNRIRYNCQTCREKK